MRKSTLFISAALTAFVLAVLFGVVSAYQNIAGASETAAQPAPTAEATQVAVAVAPTQAATQVPAAAATQPAKITPQQAASIASGVLGRTDLYSVEETQYNGQDVYLVTFSSGDLVYVNMEGQVVFISKLPVTVVKSTSHHGGGGNGGGGGGGGGGGDDGGNDHDGGGDD